MIGTKLGGRYELLREIGRGGMGVVYLAEDPMLDRQVAIKVLAPNLLNSEMEKRFKREAQTVARADHGFRSCDPFCRSPHYGCGINRRHSPI